MNTADPLAALNPLRQPEPVAWWPPAPGWWVLLCIILVSVGLLALWLRRRHRRNRYKRLALQQLAILREHQRNNPDPQAFVVAVNTLLKSVAVHAFGARAVASEYGHRWVEFLNQTGPDGSCFEDALGDAGYRPGPPELDIDQLSRNADQWIRSHREAT